MVYEDDDCSVWYTRLYPEDHGFRVQWKAGSILEIVLAAFDCRFSDLEYFSKNPKPN